MLKTCLGTWLSGKLSKSKFYLKQSWTHFLHMFAYAHKLKHRVLCENFPRFLSHLFFGYTKESRGGKKRYSTDHLNSIRTSTFWCSRLMFKENIFRTTSSVTSMVRFSISSRWFLSQEGKRELTVWVVCSGDLVIYFRLRTKDREVYSMSFYSCWSSLS